MRGSNTLIQYLKKDRRFSKAIERYWIVCVLLFIPSCNSVLSTFVALGNKDALLFLKSLMILWFFAQAVRGLRNLYTQRKLFRHAPHLKVKSQLPEGLDWPPIIGIYYGDY